MKRARAAIVLALVVGVRIAIDVATLVGDPTRYQQWEEAYNATVALWAWNGLPPEAFLALQYKSFCGGCSVVSAIGTPLLGVFGDRMLAWKGVPLLWTAATMAVGFVAIDRHAGRAAAWAFAALFALPPTGLVDLSLIAWGNHVETTLLVLAMAALTSRPGALGALASAAAWFGRTSLYGAAVWVPIALARTGRLRCLLGLAAGALLFAIPAGSGDAGLYEFDRLLPDGWSGAARRAAALLSPADLHQRAFPMLPEGQIAAGMLLAAAAIGVACVAVDRDRKRLPFVAMAATFAGVFCLGGFALLPMGPGSLPMNGRYHAPWLALLLVVTAAGAGPWLARGGARRAIGALAILLALSASAWGAVHRFSGWRPDEGVARRGATDTPRLVVFAGDRLPARILAPFHADDPDVEAAVRAAEGLARAREAVHRGETRDEVLHGLEPAVLLGAGLAFAARPISDADVAKTNRWLAALPPASAEALGTGMGANLGFALALGPNATDVSGATTAAVARLRDGVPEGKPCWLCVAAGRTAASGCGAWRPTPPPSLPA
ncbi:MAG: hypothetical protein ACOZNI_24150, partial [Myxococcota bacterium]